MKISRGTAVIFITLFSIALSFGAGFAQAHIYNTVNKNDEAVYAKLNPIAFLVSTGAIVAVVTILTMGFSKTAYSFVR